MGLEGSQVVARGHLALQRQGSSLEYLCTFALPGFVPYERGIPSPDFTLEIEHMTSTQ